MSIEAAAKELTKEIDRLTKETERLTKFRDSLLAGSVSTGSGPIRRVGKKKASKKVAAKKAVLKKATAPKKRTLSAAGRKAISEAAKRRWAEKKKADAGK